MELTHTRDLERVNLREKMADFLNFNLHCSHAPVWHLGGPILLVRIALDVIRVGKPGRHAEPTLHGRLERNHSRRGADSNLSLSLIEAFLSLSLSIFYCNYKC